MQLSENPVATTSRPLVNETKLLGFIGAYRLESRLGQGGMGEVFLGWDERLHRHVAIKRIRAERVGNRSSGERFRREARAIARLSHPAIVQVFDVLEGDGPHGDSIVMEYVEGRSLIQAIDDGDLDMVTVVRLAGEIAAGLAEAHGKSLVHRDLKPANVMLTAGRCPHAKILDFGLALWKAPLSHDTDDPLTASNAVVGTAYAMSPEQARGRSVDHRSDLFSLGNLIYHMLSGEAPFRDNSFLDTLRRVTGHEPPPLRSRRPDVPPALDALVLQLLAKYPDDRPANANLVESALRRIAVEIETVAPTAPAAIPEELTTIDNAPATEAALSLVDAGSEIQTVVRTLVLTDLVDSTHLIESLGDLHSAEVFAQHDRMARDLLALHYGLEIDKSDGFLLLFQRPFDAIGYTLDYHRGLARLTTELNVTLAARAAIHLGEVVLRHNSHEDVSRGAKQIEVEGMAKPTVARLMSLAGARQTLLSRAAFDLGRRAAVDEERWDENISWLAHGHYIIQGVEEPVEVFEVGFNAIASLIAPADSGKARRAVQVSDQVVLGWRPAAGQAIPRRDHWILAERLGEGGFGEVWLACHKSGERRVFKFCFEAERLRGLKREVTLFRLLRDALGLRHDIARILDWSFDEGPYFLEVEYTEGGSLPEWAKAQGGLARVPLETRLELVAQVAEALSAAHSVGILHKDVKPDNVLITTDPSGQPRSQLTDFGIGLLTDRSILSARGVTAAGFTETEMEDSGAGSRLYMAPELIEGKAATVQADVYSLGVMLYQVLVGDLSRALAPGWRREVDDELLAEDIALFVDGAPEERTRNALEVAKRLRSLETRRERRRASRRGQRRRRMALATTSLLSLLLAVVSIFALQAVRARNRESILHQDAMLRQKQAEGLIGFMLDDLHAKLEPLGRLDILKAISDQAMEYFASVPADKLTDEELYQRSEALNQLGAVHLDELDLKAARTSYEEALALAQVLVERDSRNVEWQTRLASGHFHVGYMFWKEGDPDRAMEEYKAQLDITQRLAEQYPDDPDLQLEWASSRNNIGFVLRARGQFEEAAEAFRFAVQITEGLAGEQPLNAELQYEYLNRLAALGSAEWRIGEVGEALRCWELSLSVAEAVLEQDPSSTLFKGQLVIVHRVLGEALTSVSTFEDAQRHLRTAQRFAEELVALVPEQTRWQMELGILNHRIGRGLAGQKRAVEARDHVHRGLQILAELTARQSIAANLRRLADAHLSVGEVEARLENRPKARQWADKAIALLEPLAAERPEDRKIHWRLGQALILLGRTQPSPSQAEKIWERAAAVLEPFAGESSDLHLLEPWHQVLEFLGRLEEAEEVEHRREELRQKTYPPQS